jgi:predicted protein tyrosine phosphatase
MPPPQLAILGYSEAGQFIRQTDPRLFVGIISIHGANESALETRDIPRLDLQFDDVDVPPTNDHVAQYQARQLRLAREAMGLHEIPPTPRDAQAIIDFAQSLVNEDGVLLIHCSGGISRSPAAGLLCFAAWQGPGRETHCVQELLRIRRCAMPHESLIRFGDDRLARHGKLLAAAHRMHIIGRPGDPSANLPV